MENLAYFDNSLKNPLTLEKRAFVGEEFVK